MHTVHNERIKLLATAFNNLGVGSIIAGTVAPTVSGRIGDFAHISAWVILGANLISLAWVLLGRLQT